MIADITISCRSFVFSQSFAKVFASVTYVSGLAVAVFDLVCYPLLSSRLSLSLTLVSGRRKLVNGLCVMRML